jgi:hypothetical protein
VTPDLLFGTVDQIVAKLHEARRWGISHFAARERDAFADVSELRLQFAVDDLLCDLAHGRSTVHS